MGEPPFVLGASQVRVAVPAVLPMAPCRFVGAPGVTSTSIAGDAPEGLESPTRLVATTVKLWDLPGSKPGKSTSVAREVTVFPETESVTL